MKTQATMTKCLAKKQVFTRKCTYFTIIDNNRSGFLAENAQITLKFGAKANPNRLIGHRPIDPSEEHGVGFRWPDDPMVRWPDLAFNSDL